MIGRSIDRSLVKFALGALAWGFGLFALLRLPWLENRLLLPLVAIEREIALWYGARSSVPVLVTLECSGADVLAMLLAVTLAYPATWGMRLAGAAGGLLFVLTLNTMRIMTLWSVAASPALFRLHLYVWPALLTLATMGYLLAWIRTADRSAPPAAPSPRPRPDARATPRPGVRLDTARGPAGRRFAGLTLVGLVLLAGAAPWLLTSPLIGRMGAGVAATAGGLLRLAGVPATVSGSLLVVPGGGFLVTPDCLVGPLAVIVLAAALALPSTWATRGLALLIAGPVLGAVAVARVLVVATPPILGASPLLLVHGFNQLLVAGLAVAGAAMWRERATPGWRPVAGHALAGLAVGAGVAAAGGGLYTGVVLWLARVARVVAPHVRVELTGPGDVQGALWLLPGYQLGLFVALAVAALSVRRWGAILGGVLALVSSQVLLLVALGEAGARLGWEPHTLLVRAWAVAGPCLLLAALMGLGCRSGRAPNAELPPAGRLSPAAP